MGYYAGTSTGPNDLLDKLRVALLAEGWTVDDHSAVGAGYRLHVHKTAGDATVMYFNFRSAIAETGVTLITEDNYSGADGTVTGLIVNGSTGYDGGELWHVQPGYPENADLSDKSFGNVMSPMSTTAIPAYYFFFNGESVHIVVEITAGKFQFMSFGLLVKQGAYTGGQYFTASMGSRRPWYDYQGTFNYDDSRYFVSVPSQTGELNGAVYVNVDSVASWRISGRGGVAPANDQIIFPCPSAGDYSPTKHRGGLASFFYSLSPDAYNAMSAMCPLYTLLRRSDDNYSLLGWPEGVRYLNVTIYDSGEEITYGAETWVAFHDDSLEADPVNVGSGFAFLKDE